MHMFACDGAAAPLSALAAEERKMARIGEARELFIKSLGRGYAIWAARELRGGGQRGDGSLMDRLGPEAQDDAPFFRTEGRDRLARLWAEYRAYHERLRIERGDA
jgi:hypothetical protein